MTNKAFHYGIVVNILEFLLSHLITENFNYDLFITSLCENIHPSDYRNGYKMQCLLIAYPVTCCTFRTHEANILLFCFRNERR